MKKLLLLSIFSLLFLSYASAQTVELSNSMDNRETGNPEEFLGSYDGKLFYSAFDLYGKLPLLSIPLGRKESDKFFFKIFVYDEQGKEKPEIYLYKDDIFKSLSKEKDIYFLNAFLMNDSLTVLYTNKAKKNEKRKIYASRISLEDPKNVNEGRSVLVAEFKPYHEKDRVSITVKKSQDGSRIIFYSLSDVYKKEPVIVNYGVMNGDVSNIITSSFTTEIEEKTSRGVFKSFVSQNGTAYFVFGVYKDKIRSAIGYIHSSETKELKTFEFIGEDEEEIISSITMTELKDDKILLAEYRSKYDKPSKKNPKGTLMAGIYSRIIDGNTFEETALEPILFGKKQFKDFDLEWPGDKTNNLKSMFFEQVYLDEPIIDGDNVYITGCNYYTTEYRSKTGMVYVTGHWNGILVAKMSISKNEFEYLTTVPMTQTLTYSSIAGLGEGYFEYAALPINNKLVLLLNDHEKNIAIKDNAKLKTYNMRASVYKMITIDQDGKKTSKYLDPGKMKEKNPILVLPTATMLDNKIVLLGNNMKKRLNTIVTISP